MDGRKRKGLASGLSWVRAQEVRDWRGGDEERREASLRPICPKVMALKNVVKSEIDVATLTLPGISDNGIEQRASAGELSQENAVRMSRGD